MFEPMYEHLTATVFGIPWAYVIAVVGFLGMVVGIYWIHRINTDEPAPQSFYATADRQIGPSLGLILRVALAGLFLIAFSFIYYSTGGGASQHLPTMSLNDWFLIAGIALELVAIALFLRRLSAHSRN